MDKQQYTFKDYYKNNDLEKKTRKKLNKKSHKGRHYGGLSQPSLKDLESGNATGMSGGSGAQVPGAFGLGGAGVSENYSPKFSYSNSKRGFSFINRASTHEEDAETPSKKDKAKAMYPMLVNSGLSRQDIINTYQNRLGVTQQTAVAYFERIAREFGHTGQKSEEPTYYSQDQQGMFQSPMGMGGEPEQLGAGEEETPEVTEPQEWDDPNRQGEIRTVDGAHLVYKRQTEDGTFEELWLFKNNEENSYSRSKDIRKDILAGTDIQPNQTQSDDGTQTAETWVAGNATIIFIIGIPN